MSLDPERMLLVCKIDALARELFLFRESYFYREEHIGYQDLYNNFLKEFYADGTTAEHKLEICEFYYKLAIGYMNTCYQVDFVDRDEGQILADLALGYQAITHKETKATPKKRGRPRKRTS